MREIHETWKEIMEIYKEAEQYNEQESVFDSVISGNVSVE